GEGCEPELQQDVGGRCPPTVLRLGLDEGDVAEITGFGCRDEAPQCRVSELMAARDERSPMPPGDDGEPLNLLAPRRRRRPYEDMPSGHERQARHRPPA